MYVAKLMVSYLVKLHSIQNHTPTLPNPYSDFAKIPLRFSHKITAWFGWLIFTKSHSDFTKSQSDFHKIILRLCQNPTPIFTKSLPDFHNITGWFSQNHTPTLPRNHTPTLPESHSDFTKIALRFSQNHCLIFTTSLADFHKITLRLCQNHTPTLPKSPTDLHKITDWFSQKPRVDFEAPDCCFTVRRFKIAPSPIVRPACQKVSAVSSRACRVALTVFVLVCEKKLSVVYR